jgi:hypothetical protein
MVVCELLRRFEFEEGQIIPGSEVAIKNSEISLFSVILAQTEKKVNYRRTVSESE